MEIVASDLLEPMLFFDTPTNPNLGFQALPGLEQHCPVEIACELHV